VCVSSSESDVVVVQFVGEVTGGRTATCPSSEKNTTDHHSVAHRSLIRIIDGLYMYIAAKKSRLVR